MIVKEKTRLGRPQRSQAGLILNSVFEGTYYRQDHMTFIELRHTKVTLASYTVTNVSIYEGQ